MCAFYRHIWDDPAFASVALAIHERQREKVLRGYATLCAHGRPTELGSDLMQRIARAVDDLASARRA